MSKINDIAEMIRTRIITAPLEGELPTLVDLTLLYQPNEDLNLHVDAVLVNRQKETQSKVAAAQSRARGTAIVIQWDQHAPQDRNSTRPKMGYTYSIQIWSKPVIAEEDFPADDVFESVVARLWQWVPGATRAGTGASNQELVLMAGGVMPNKTFMIYEFGVIAPALL